MKVKKILILVIVLSLPVILYLFLTYFGNNEFDLPVYFAEENEKCDEFQQLKDVNGVIHLNENNILLSEILKGNINVVHFPNPRIDNQQLINELDRLISTLSEEGPVVVHSFFKGDSTPDDQLPELLASEAASSYQLDVATHKSFTECYFALPTVLWQGNHPSEMELPQEQILVLVDKDLKIRGYYDGLETKDVDRLILEIRILLSK